MSWPFMHGAGGLERLLLVVNKSLAFLQDTDTAPVAVTGSCSRTRKASGQRN